MRNKDLIGKTIKLVKQTVWYEDGVRMSNLDRIILDDGSEIRFMLEKNLRLGASVVGVYYSPKEVQSEHQD